MTLSLPEQNAAYTWRARLPESSMLVDILAATLRRADPNHPAYKAHCYEQGHGQVRLVEGALDNLPELIHTALRKCAHSEQSSLAWNAIHKLHPSDGKAFWQTTRTTLQAVFSGEELPTRLALATRLSQDLKDALDARDHGLSGAQYDAEDDDDPEFPVLSRARREMCAYALQVMCLAVRATSTQEWMWGWLGFVVEDCENESAPVAQADEQGAA